MITSRFGIKVNRERAPIKSTTKNKFCFETNFNNFLEIMAPNKAPSGTIKENKLELKRTFSFGIFLD
jgi:hypothetical protein